MVNKTLKSQIVGDPSCAQKCSREVIIMTNMTYFANVTVWHNLEVAEFGSGAIWKHAVIVRSDPSWPPY